MTSACLKAPAARTGSLSRMAVSRVEPRAGGFSARKATPRVVSRSCPAQSSIVLQVVFHSGGTSRAQCIIMWETTLQSGGSPITINSGLTYQISFRARWVCRLERTQRRASISIASPRASRWPLRSLPVEALRACPIPRRWPTPAPPPPSSIHSPAVPLRPINPRRSLLVSGVSDPDGVASVTLFYAVNGGSFVSSPDDQPGKLAPIPP